jgi:hypothetical protein
VLSALTIARLQQESSRKWLRYASGRVWPPYADSSFDLVLQSTVFTSILSSDIRKRVALEMIRVTRRGGAILWYDYFRNNPRNPDVRSVTATETRAVSKVRSSSRAGFARAAIGWDNSTCLLSTRRSLGSDSVVANALSRNDPSGLSPMAFARPNDPPCRPFVAGCALATETS